MARTRRSETVEDSYKEGKKLTDNHKKKLQKMERVMYKYRTKQVDFKEFIKRLQNIEEFYQDD